jgi:hypothetical protein
MELSLNNGKYEQNALVDDLMKNERKERKEQTENVFG